MRVATIANHTLTGQMVDPHGAFKTYHQLVEDQRAERRSVATYDDALKERTQDLLRCLIGQPKDSTAPIYPSLIAAMREIAEPVRRHYRLERKRESIAVRAAIDAKMEEDRLRQLAIHERIKRGEKVDMWEEFGLKFDADKLATRLSDIIAGRASMFQESGDATDRVRTYEFKEQVREARRTSPARTSNLVVADSEVETFIDSVHLDGRYTTRTKGSPFVRKELPESLKPFCPHQDGRPSTQRLLASARGLFM